MVVLSPSWPLLLGPQQYAAPLIVTPQVASAALIAANVRLPATGVGMGRLAVVPSPRWPLSLMPQQYALPEALRAHECLLPASTSTDTPVAVKSTVLGNAAAAAVSLFPANAVLDPSTHGAEAQPVDPVR